jgi:transposase
MKVRTNRRFSPDFKRTAVERSLQSQQTVREVAATFGIHPNMLSRWRCELTQRDKDDPNSVPNEGPEKSAQELARENQRLKKKLERVEVENEILKKANEHFAKLQR